MSAPGPQVLLAGIPEGTLVAVDTETSGLHPDSGARVSVVSVAWVAEVGGEEMVVGATFPFDQGMLDKIPSRAELDFGNPNLGREAWEWLLRWLRRRRLIFHNAKFDLTMLSAGTRHWPGRDLEAYWDTMIAQSALDPLEQQGLGACAVRLGLGGGEKKGSLDKALKAQAKALKLGGDMAKRYDLLSWDAMEPYATQDAKLTLLLYLHQWDRLMAGEGSWSQIEFRLQVMRALWRMENRGIGYDREGSLDAVVLLEQRMAQIEQELPFKATRNGAIAYFSKIYRFMQFTPTGKPQLTEEVVRRLVEDGIPWATEWAEWTKLHTAVSMWYQGYADLCGDDGRLRTVYKQTRVKTGRMAVERLQLQAIPKSMAQLVEGVPPVRALFRSREGYELWNLDLSQAELRAAAKYARCKRMLAMLAEGADLHGVTCSQIFGITPSHPEWKQKRDIAKRLTFGGIFQIGPKTFQATLSKAAGIYLPLRECEEIVREWRNAYPEFGHAYYRAMRIADRAQGGRGWVRVMPNTPYEERSYFGPFDYPNSAWSRIVQSSLALFNQVWLTETERLWPGMLVLNVHDSQVLELPSERASEVAHDVAAHGGALATKLFRTEMRVDVGQWAV